MGNELSWGRTTSPSRRLGVAEAIARRIADAPAPSPILRRIRGHDETVAELSMLDAAPTPSALAELVSRGSPS